jgi:RoxA-like, cytochrome c-like
VSETGYLHGYTASERERLHRQARFLEPAVHDRLPFRRRRRLIEVGAGVGAQTEILLRHFPELYVTGVEINDAQIAEARRFLATVPWATGRYDIVKGAELRSDKRIAPELTARTRCAIGWRITTTNSPLRGLWQHAPYFHDGSAPDLLAVINHYDQQFNLSLTRAQKADLVACTNEL